MEETVVKVEHEEDVMLPIVSAMAIAILTLILFFLRHRFFGRPNTILFVGLNDAGKTVLFSKLINKNNAPLTYSSLKENIFDDYLDKNGCPLTLVDFPGAERLRKQLIAKYFHEKRNYLKGIIFVVDSATFSKKARDVAELFYEVLYESGKRLPALVACNKQDIPVAKTSLAIRSALEREFGMINASKEAALESTDGDTKKKTLTNTGRNFQWSDLPYAKIDFAECSAMATAAEDEGGAKKEDLEQVANWIDAL